MHGEELLVDDGDDDFGKLLCSLKSKIIPLTMNSQPEIQGAWKRKRKRKQERSKKPVKMVCCKRVNLETQIQTLMMLLMNLMDSLMQTWKA